MKQYPFYCLFILGILVAACSQAPANTPRQVVEWEATPQTTRTPLPTLTPPIVVTRATVEAIGPTPLPPLEIPTLEPTAIPAGVYYRESDGFSFNYPANWEIIEDIAETVTLQDPDLNIILSISSGFTEEGASLDLVIDELLTLELPIEGITVTQRSQTPFGDDTAQTAWLTSPEEPDGLALWVAYAQKDTHEYSIIAFGTAEMIQARQKTITTIIDQITPAGSKLFNLDRAETLVLLGGDPLARSLDPARTTGSAAGYVGLLYRGLVRLTPDLHIVPDLAQTWQVSDDGTQYTFTLRDDIAFASGKPITAQDIQYSWERAADPATESTTASTYLGSILGVNDKLADKVDNIEGVEVIDERTLIVTLDGPKPFFLAQLTYPTSFVIDKATVDADDENWVFNPNPSGPYDLQTYRENEAIVFEQNQQYHTPAQIPNVIYLTGRVGTSLSLYEAGEVDIIFINGEDAKDVRLPSNQLHDQWVSTTSLCTSQIYMNNTEPPFDDINVRRAFALAIDKDGLNELLSEGTNLRADTTLPPGMPGYDLTLAQAQAENETNNAEAAQAALAASTYAADFPPVTIIASGFGGSDRDDVNTLVEQWADVLGVEVSVALIDPINFSQTARQETSQMVISGWCADYPDPENFLDVLYHSESDFNTSNYNNPEIDALLEEARVELDPARRLTLYQEIEAALLADVAVISLSHGVDDALVNPKVQNFVLSSAGAPIIDSLSFDESIEESS